jgi:hypothetical protein
MAKAPFNVTVQRTETIAGDPSVAPMVISVSPSTYGLDQQLTISPYGEVELQLSDKNGVVGRARIGIMNTAIRAAILKYPASLASKYNDAPTLREGALWLADLQTATTAALAEIDALLQPEAVPAG